MKTATTSKPSFDHVLVATDLTTASGAAFQVALNVCSDLGAKLTVLHVTEDSSIYPETGDTLLESMDASLSQVMETPLHCLHVLPRTPEGLERSHNISQIMSKALQQLVDKDDGTSIKFPICVTVYGNEISESIVDYARQARAKLIVLGVRRASMMASHVPARLAYQIIANAPCPVMTVAF